ncbi:hypothetical protein ACFFW8_11965 [Erwinia tracheiphila]
MPDDQQTIFKGKMLESLLASATTTLQQQMEGGKAPLLGMVNNGKIVPVVLGFSKVAALKTHSISGSLGKVASNYHYQSQNHPLTGSAKGGR